MTKQGSRRGASSSERIAPFSETFRRHIPSGLIAGVPKPVKRALGRTLADVRTRTEFARMMPTFMIAGAQRSGTTALYEYLAAHPAVARAAVHEIHFFDFNFHRGLPWYRSHFPLRPLREHMEGAGRRGKITGEGTPYYMFHPLALDRVAATIPDIKLLFVLRNPVERAHSHYHRERLTGFETLSFEDAIDEEPARLDGEEQKIRADAGYYSFNHQHFSYVSRGLYARQLENVFALFPRDHVMVVASEDLWSNTANVYARILDFLDLPAHHMSRFPQIRGAPRLNTSGPYQDMSPETRRRLAGVFHEPNQQLYRLLQMDLGWERDSRPG
jgi:hypothetical protein